MKNWKTTLIGLLPALAALSMQVYYLYDGNPSTNPDWSVVLAALGLGGLGVFAKDRDVTGGTR